MACRKFEKKKEFLKYLNYENQNIIANLSDKKIYNLLTKKNKPILKKINHFCIEGCNYKLKKKLNKKPKNELPLNINKPYYREIHKCEKCGHFINISFLNNIKNYYEGKYVANTYGDVNNINRLFKSIISLPKNKSDNKNRVERINLFFKKIHIHNNFKVLDIGSGLGVFLYELKKQTNWQCYGLDPDKLQSMHMDKFLNIQNFNSTLENYTSKLKYDLITINKVLEHQKDPLKFLKLAIKNLKNKGFIYLEVPDGEYASKYGVSIIENEEFFIEHFHIFSLVSIIKLIEKTNLKIVNTQRIKEPSGKFTLICLCKNF